MNYQSYYQWIIELMKKYRARIEHTPGHFVEESLEAKMNHEADFYASKSQTIQNKLPTSPIPTFYMNTYTYSKKATDTLN